MVNTNKIKQHVEYLLLACIFFLYYLEIFDTAFQSFDTKTNIAISSITILRKKTDLKFIFSKN